MKKNYFLFALLFTVFFSCKKDNTPTTKNLNLNLSGLEDLGNDYVYEGWIIVDGKPESTGTFTVDASGNPSVSSFELSAVKLDAATKFVLTIEPKNDTDPAPSATKILTGAFSGSSASLNTRIIADFSSVSGKYILATPTNGMPSNENSGIWFLNLPQTGPPPTLGLELPALPSGWKYEGWVVINGIPVTTGKFTQADATDESDTYSADMPLPMLNPGGFFPGEDFLVNAPSGLTFPTDIAGGTAVISVEPSPDNSPKPFAIKPLVHKIPSDAKDHVTFEMNQNLSFPSGTASR